MFAADPKPPLMVRYFTKADNRVVELDNPYPRCWAHLSPPFRDGELHEFAETHDIPLDFLVDSLDIDERSRYEREEDVRLILINSPVENVSLLEDNDAIYVTAPIGIVLTPEITVTVTSAKETILQLFVDERIRAFDPADESMFVLRILEQNVFRFTSFLRELNKRRNVIERELYDSSRNKELRNLLAIEKSLVFFVNSLSTNELLKMKMKRTDFLGIRNDEIKSDLFEDIIIDNSQALEMSNIYTNILGGTMDAYSSIISNNLNVVIQRLTFITIVLTVPTLVASLFGMNVQLPFSDKPWAFGAVLGISVVFSLLFVVYFQRKKLL
jgi:magnesium transporter